VGGIFTPTEASIAAVLATIGAGAIYNAMSLKVLRDSLRETLELLGPVMLVVAASGMFGYILTSEQAGESLGRFLGSISESRTVVLLLIVGLLLLLGCVMEVLSVLILLTPLLIPIILHLGVDPVYFGVLMVFTLSIGLITPPVGLCMYVSCSIAKVSMEGYTRELIPFLAVLVAVNLLIVFFPELVMYVPNLLMPAK
jgi:tripartite ATP-independent transporter DctM subunit